MVLQHITWKPDTCDCVLEQQVDEGVDPTLWFFHSVCPKHLPLVQNKPQLSKAQLKSKREIIASHHKKLLDANRVRHLKQFDEDPTRKQKLGTIKELLKTLDTQQVALRMESQAMEDRIIQERFLDKHEGDSMDYLLMGIYSPYAFIAQDVYDRILEEQRQKNGVSLNG